MPQFKKDTATIVAQGLCVLGLIAVLYFGKIDWAQFVVGLGLLQVPAAFGRSKEDEAAK